MSPTKQATKKPVVQPKRPKSNLKPSKRAWEVNSGIIVSSVLLNITQCASLLGVQHAAEVALMFFSTIERLGVQANIDLQIIADDAADLIIAIWRLQEKSENPKKWASPEIRDMVGNLKAALEKVNRIAERQAKRNRVVRVIFDVIDAGQIRVIRQTREIIATEVSRFQMNELLLKVAAKQQELSEGTSMKNLRTPRVEDEEEEEEEEEEILYLPPRQTTRPTPAFVAPNSYGYDVSIPSPNEFNGSGNMFNTDIGDVTNSMISNVGNDNSITYYSPGPDGHNSISKNLFHFMSFGATLIYGIFTIFSATSIWYYLKTFLFS